MEAKCVRFCLLQKGLARPRQKLKLFLDYLKIRLVKRPFDLAKESETEKEKQKT